MARLAMTAHVTGDGQDPPAGRPRTAAALEQDINPLQRLIRQRLSERGWSYGEVARRGSLPRSTVYTLATTRNLTRPPRPDTIDALAKGLDVPVAVVRAAAAASTGLHYYDQGPAERERPGDPDRELLIASIDELTPEDRRHVAALVESLRKRTSPPADRLAPAPAHAADAGFAASRSGPPASGYSAANECRIARGPRWLAWPAGPGGEAAHDPPHAGGKQPPSGPGGEQHRAPARPGRPARYASIRDAAGLGSAGPGGGHCRG